LSRHREKSLKNLRLAFVKDKSEREIRVLARRVFEHMAQTGVEVLKFRRLNREKVEALVGTEEAEKKYRKILGQKKGLISLTAHMGNWELLAGIFGLKGFQGGVLARRIYYEPYDRWIVGLRQAVGIRTLYRDDSPKALIKLLKRNEILGILADQDIDSVNGIFVDFFGRPAYTPVAPAKLAVASGAPILPNFLLWDQGDRYRLVLGEVIEPAVKTNREAAVRDITVQWMRACEEVIRRYPEQWGWMHDRWKTREDSPRGSAKERAAQKAAAT